MNSALEVASNSINVVLVMIDSLNNCPGSYSVIAYSINMFFVCIALVPPEKMSIVTQILLGISLGVNISIGAFVLGRYSMNGDLLSFV